MKHAVILLLGALLLHNAPAFGQSAASAVVAPAPLRQQEADAQPKPAVDKKVAGVKGKKSSVRRKKKVSSPVPEEKPAVPAETRPESTEQVIQVKGVRG